MKLWRFSVFQLLFYSSILILFVFLLILISFLRSFPSYLLKFWQHSETTWFIQSRHFKVNFKVTNTLRLSFASFEYHEPTRQITPLIHLRDCLIHNLSFSVYPTKWSHEVMKTWSHSQLFLTDLSFSYQCKSPI